MARTYLKKATFTARSDAGDTVATVAGILADIEGRGEAAAMEYAAKFDKYEGSIQLSDDEIEAAIARVPQKLKDDIDFARDFGFQILP